MAHLLIADADAQVRRTLRQALEPAAHVADETDDVNEVASLVAHSAAISDPFDLLLLGQFSGGADALALMRQLGHATCDHAVVLVGDTPDYAGSRMGVIGTIDATRPLGEILDSFKLALARRERYLARLGEWDLALQYLNVLDKAGLEGPATRLADQRAAIFAQRDRLAAAVGAAEPDEASIGRALEAVESAANAALNLLPTRIEDLLAPLANYCATPTFWTALRQAFTHDRVRALALFAVLRQLDRDKLAHGLVIGGTHFQYPIGGSYTVFFRWSNGLRVLEDFAPTIRLEGVTMRLTSAPEAPVVLVGLPTPAG
jgi:hypothetical protein